MAMCFTLHGRTLRQQTIHRTREIRVSAAELKVMMSLFLSDFTVFVRISMKLRLSGK